MTICRISHFILNNQNEYCRLQVPNYLISPHKSEITHFIRNAFCFGYVNKMNASYRVEVFDKREEEYCSIKRNECICIYSIFHSKLDSKIRKLNSIYLIVKALQPHICLFSLFCFSRDSFVHFRYSTHIHIAFSFVDLREDCISS